MTGDGRAARQRALRLAHRGDHRHDPENSLAAMRAALAVRGCDGLEFDVQASADGTPILLHDETLERTHGRPERPDEIDTASLRQLGVPTLTDVLAAVPDGVFLDVELKIEIASAVAPILSPRIAHGAPVIVSSFEADVLVAVGQVAPALERWLNSETLDPGDVRRALDLGCSTISARASEIDAPSIETARAAGLEVAAWTARTIEEVERLDALGVSAICVEGPALGS